MSNLKQVGLGILQYAQDYDERFPMSYYEPGVVSPNAAANVPANKFLVSNGTASGYWMTWMDCIFPYVKSVQLFTCPSPSSFATTYYDYAHTPSYGYNGWVGGFFGGGPLSLASLRQPSQLLLSSDSQQPYSIYDTQVNVSYLSNPANDLVFPHLDGMNVLYADGHVKWSNRMAAVLRDVDKTWLP